MATRGFSFFSLLCPTEHIPFFLVKKSVKVSLQPCDETFMRFIQKSLYQMCKCIILLTKYTSLDIILIHSYFFGDVFCSAQFLASSSLCDAVNQNSPLYQCWGSAGPLHTGSDPSGWGSGSQRSPPGRFRRWAQLQPCAPRWEPPGRTPSIYPLCDSILEKTRMIFRIFAANHLWSCCP